MLEVWRRSMASRLPAFILGLVVFLTMAPFATSAGAEPRYAWRDMLDAAGASRFRRLALLQRRKLLVVIEDRPEQVTAF